MGVNLMVSESPLSVSVTSSDKIKKSKGRRLFPKSRNFHQSREPALELLYRQHPAIPWQWKIHLLQLSLIQSLNYGHSVILSSTDLNTSSAPTFLSVISWQLPSRCSLCQSLRARLQSGLPFSPNGFGTTGEANRIFFLTSAVVGLF